MFRTVVQRLKKSLGATCLRNQVLVVGAAGEVAQRTTHPFHHSGMLRMNVWRRQNQRDAALLGDEDLVVVVYKYAYTYVCVCVCVCIYMYVCMYVCMYIYISIYLSIYLYIYIYTKTVFALYKKTISPMKQLTNQLIK